MNGLDVRRLLRIIAERVTDETDRLDERRLAHIRVLPRDVHQCGLRHNPAGALDEMLQDGDRPRRQPELVVAPTEQPVGEIEAERTEVDDRTRAWMEDQRPSRTVLLHGVPL